MNYKNILNPIATLLLLPVLVIALIQFWGISLKDIMVGIVAMTLYAALIAVYLLRFALIFLGVFAAYRLLREQHDKQLVA